MTSEIGKPPGGDELADRLAIQDILGSHCRGLDRRDEALLKACYWPDATVDYGSYRGPAQAFAELVLPALAARYELTRHCLANTLVAFQHSGALVESYVSASHLLHGAEREMLFEGRYLDTLEQRDGRWKLQHRQVVMDWSRHQGVADERDSEAFADMAKSGHTRGDPLYALLGDGTARVTVPAESSDGR